MSIDARPEQSVSPHVVIDPELVREIDTIEATGPPRNIELPTDFFRDLDSLTYAMAPRAIVEKAIQAYFHDINSFPAAEQPAWWKLYFETVLPMEAVDGERVRWVGQVAAWLIDEDQRFRSLPNTELSEAVYARRGIVEALDAKERAGQGLPPRAPAWDSEKEEPWLARNGQ